MVPIEVPKRNGYCCPGDVSPLSLYMHFCDAWSCQSSGTEQHMSRSNCTVKPVKGISFITIAHFHQYLHSYKRKSVTAVSMHGHQPREHWHQPTARARCALLSLPYHCTHRGLRHCIMPWHVFNTTVAKKLSVYYKWSNVPSVGVYIKMICY